VAISLSRQAIASTALHAGNSPCWWIVERVCLISRYQPNVRFLVRRWRPAPGRQESLLRGSRAPCRVKASDGQWRRLSTRGVAANARLRQTQADYDLHRDLHQPLTQIAARSEVGLPLSVFRYRRYSEHPTSRLSTGWGNRFVQGQASSFWSLAFSATACELPVISRSARASERMVNPSTRFNADAIIEAPLPNFPTPHALKLDV
jgi:hypothetical protein